MSEPASGGMIRQNWHLLLVLAALVAGLGGYIAFGGGEAETVEAVPASAVPAVAENAPAPLPLRAAGAEDARRLIADYEAKLSENPQQPDAPALLFAAGNLYKQKLMDYAAAAEKYHLLLIEHPEWPQTKQVYPLLDVCYEQLGDREGKRWLYNLILEREPEDSQEFIYATQQLEAL